MKQLHTLRQHWDDYDTDVHFSIRTSTDSHRLYEVSLSVLGLMNEPHPR